jgi:hypothetical protein
VPDPKKLDRQIKHLNQHKAKFQAELPGWTIERYFGQYAYSTPDLYSRLCKRLKIEEKS